MATVLIRGKTPAVVTRASVDRGRLLDAMTFWGSESAWWDHRLARLKLERDALIAWCDGNEDWFDDRFRRRNRRICFLYQMQNVARERLADIAQLVADLAKTSPREMAQLTERFAIARQDEPTPMVRPAREAIPATEWAQAKTKGWTEWPPSKPR